MSARRATRPRPPEGLRTAGKRLWRDIHRQLVEEAELTERETAILLQACKQADDLARLEEAVESGGVEVPGSMGQTRLNPALIELRQGRIVLMRLLGELDLSEPEEPADTARSQRARHAATARWRQRDELAKRRRAG